MIIKTKARGKVNKILTMGATLTLTRLIYLITRFRIFMRIGTIFFTLREKRTMLIWLIIFLDGFKVMTQLLSIGRIDDSEMRREGYIFWFSM